MSWRPSWWLDFLKVYWPLNQIGAKATGLPWVGNALTALLRPLFGEKQFNITYLPIHVKIEPVASTVLSQSVIAGLIKQSAYRVIIKRCSCRDSKGCKTYPSTDSCLLLGYDTRHISSKIAKHVSVDEALRHVDAQLALGLTPMTGRVRMDDLFYGVPNRGRMLTVCFCCPCCCTILNSAKYFPEEFRASIVKLQGTRIEVDAEKCKLCGDCVAACFMDAISIQNGAVIHVEELCLGCGHCSTVCPEKATRLSIADPEAAVDEILGRIGQRVSVK
jgi:Fe-S-cluster-containing hydrogenase component 2